MNILYYGACWPTNIGNAFIDYGSMYTIKAAAPGARVFMASELPRWLYKLHEIDMDASIDLAELIEVDFVVVSGMNLCDEFIEVEGPVIEKLSRRGVKIILNGCGGASYTSQEIENFKNFLGSVNVVGFISRDEASFLNYKDCFTKSFNGIDCAFFLPQAFIPAPLRIKDFIVFNFDSSEEPPAENPQRRIIRTKHSCDQILVKPRRERALRAGLKLMLNRSKNVKPLTGHKDTLVSDLPDDYINLYANTYATYSDRVHACLATLAFGNLARLYSKSPRAALFDRIGASAITSELIKPDLDLISREKRNQISMLKELLQKK
ncbi:MAG: polysaccharide pyruvyl transferase family protein [Chloroflexi bacterium]|nr:polysaccharide pyruvyl transferase family protein [Chloroflexota bacterium]